MLDPGRAGVSRQTVGDDATNTVSRETISSRTPPPARPPHDLDLRDLTRWDQWNDDHDHALPIPGIWPHLRAADAA